MRERERWKSLEQIPTVDEAINAYLNAKRVEEKNKEISRLTLYEIESKMRIVRARFGPLKVTEIDEAAVSTFLRELPHAARGKANIRTKLSQFLNYCRREGKWITLNPTENIKVRVKNGEVKVLSVEEAARLLSAAQACEHPASVIPFLVVQLFGGLRPFEAERLHWERIHFKTRQIEVLGSTSKTRETRFVQMESLLVEWLLPFCKRKGSIRGPEFINTLQAVKREAGFTFGDDDSNPWPKDVLRHCFGSYWLAVHKDRAHLAELMGTSLPMIKTHYKRAIPRGVAQRFWKLAPVLVEPGKVIPVPATAWSKQEPDLTFDREDSQMNEMEEQIEFLQQPLPEFPTLKFRFAKTLAETPHAYTVRSQANEGEYAKLFGLIDEHGVWEVWGKNGRRYQYYYRDGFKYWRMGQVINRAKA